MVYVTTAALLNCVVGKRLPNAFTSSVKETFWKAEEVKLADV